MPGSRGAPAAPRPLTPQQVQERERRIQPGRLAAADDVAYLVSNGAAYVNGMNLFIDGGLHIADIA